VSARRDELGHWCFNGNVLVAEIQLAVAADFAIPVGEMTSARRTQPFAFARQVAMYLSRELTPYSLPHIGRMFRRDHTTILYGIKTIEAKIAADPALAERIVGIRDRLQSERKSWRQRVLDRIEDPAVCKSIVMRWWEQGEITPAQAETLIRDGGLVSA
jgi:hypothetical protein